MMKSILLVTLISLISLSGCARLHTNTKGSDVDVAPVEAIPLEVGVKVGEKITGDCSYKALFGFSLVSPEKRTFGVEFNPAHANFGGICTEGAVYEAITKANADVLIAPRYSVGGKTFLCLPFIDACAWRSIDITVTGLKGTYEKFEKISPDMRKSRLMSPNSKKNGSWNGFNPFSH